MANVGFIASTIPAKVERAGSGSTLFSIAMIETGDPLQWAAIASLNQIADPWIVSQESILIPPVLPTGAQTGILTPTWPMVPAALPPVTTRNILVDTVGQPRVLVTTPIVVPIFTFEPTYFILGF